jgi:hypothetical protein
VSIVPEQLGEALDPHICGSTAAVRG